MQTEQWTPLACINIHKHTHTACLWFEENTSWVLQRPTLGPPPPGWPRTPVGSSTPGRPDGTRSLDKTCRWTERRRRGRGRLLPAWRSWLIIVSNTNEWKTLVNVCLPAGAASVHSQHTHNTPTCLTAACRPTAHAHKCTRGIFFLSQLSGAV